MGKIRSKQLKLNDGDFILGNSSNIGTAQNFNAAVSTILYDSIPTSNVLTVKTDANISYGEFATIESALASITTNSISNRFKIEVQSGTYNENPLQMKPYVSIVGCDIDSVIIDANDTEMPLITGVNNALISNLQLTGVDNTGSYCVQFEDAIEDIESMSFFIDNVKFLNNYGHIKVISSTKSTSIFANNCKFGGTGTYSYGVHALSTGGFTSKVTLINSLALESNTITPNTLAYIIGVGAEVDLVSCNFINSRTSPVGIGVWVSNGGLCRISGTKLLGFEAAIYSENSGVGSTVYSTGVELNNNIMDIQIEQSTTTGIFHGIYSSSKVYIHPSSTFYIIGKDPHIITVGYKGCDFDNLNTALNSISDNSVSVNYLIQLNPGTYSCDQLVMKPYVEIKGSGSINTTLVANNPNEPFILGANNSRMQNCTITGASDSLGEAFYYEGDGNFGFCYIQDCIFGNNTKQIHVNSTSGLAVLFVFSCIFGGDGAFEEAFIVEAPWISPPDVQTQTIAEVSINNCKFKCLTSPFPTNFINISGPKALVNLTSSLIYSIGSTGSAILATDGAEIQVTGTVIDGFAYGIRTVASGNNLPPKVFGSGVKISNTDTLDLSIESPGTLGILNGLFATSKIFIEDSSPFALKNKDLKIVTVAKRGADFTSIAAAVNFITDSSTTNLYKVLVGPGTYIEPVINVNTGISIVGSSIQSTVVQPDTDTHHVFNCQINTEVSFLSVQNAGLGFAAFNFADVGNYAQLHKISIYNCDIGIKATSSTIDSFMYLEYLDINGIYSKAIDVSAANNFVCQVTAENYYNFPDSASAAINNCVSGLGAQLIINTCEIIGSELDIGIKAVNHGNVRLFGTSILHADIALELEDGANIEAFGSVFDGITSGIYAPNIGAPPQLKIVSCTTLNASVYELLIEHVGITGSITGSFDKLKVFIDDAITNLSISFTDPINAGSVQKGKFYLGDSISTLTDVSDLITTGTMGKVTGGVITISSGLTIDISNGFGYLMYGVYNLAGDGHALKKIDWTTQSITLSPNTENYIFFNNAGVLTTSSSPVSTTQQIYLGRVHTNSTDIIFIDNSQINAHHQGNALSASLRKMFGSLYAGGSITSELAGNPKKLSVTTGEYYFGENVYFPSGNTSTGITWTNYYRDGAGGWTEVTAQNTIPTTKYDDGSGTLADITINNYVKFILYIVGDGANEKYFLLYPQAEYVSQLLAEQSMLPNAPTYFIDTVIPIASIVIQQGGSNIASIQDIRPRPLSAASASTSVTDHGALTGLVDDDHPQYVLSNGSRTYTGDQNYGGNNITNIGTINSVVISAHAARHKHGGADEISTATPTGSAIPKADPSGKLDSWITYAPGGTDVAIADGGTGGSTPAAARTNLGLAIGTDVQAFSSNLTSIAAIPANGLLTRTGFGAYTNRVLTGTANRIVISNPAGIAADPVFDIGTDVVTLTGTQTLTNKSIAASQLTGATAIVNGGTNITTYTTGDIIQATNTDVLGKLSAVTTGNVLISGGIGTVSSWGKVGLTTHITGVLAETNGGTGTGTYTLGDILIASATNTLSKLAGNITTTRQFLRQTGNGTISALPVWDTVTKTDVGLNLVENTALSSWTGTSNITTLGTITTGVWSGTIISIAKGGHGQSTANAGFNALAPVQTGKAGKALVSNGNDTSWSDLIIQNPSTPTAATASGTNAIAFGNAAVASGQESIVLGGATNTASARYSSAIGNQAKSDIQGGFAQASGMFTAQGDAQTRVLVMRIQTTNNSPTEMFVDGSAGTIRLVLPNDTTWLFNVYIAARRTDADNESAMYRLFGGIDRNANAASTAIVGTVSKNIFAEDNASWDVTATADTTNGSLKITVTGQTAKTVNWVARIELTEVTG